MNKEERVLKYINSSTELVFAEKYYCEADFYEDVENILKENQELKKQYKEYIRAEIKLKDELEKQRKEYQETYKDVRKEIKEYKNQQKKFIEYLEDEIYTIEPKGTLINFNCDYDSEEDYIRGVEKRVALDTLTSNLSKYKKITGGKDE